MTLSQTFTAFTPEIWSPRVNMFFQAKLAAAKFFQDFSSDVANGGDIVHIPMVAQGFTPAAIATTNGAVTSANLSDTNSNITVNTWQGVAYDLTDFQYAQILKSYNVKNMYAKAMGYSLAQKFDTDLLAQSSNITPSVGNSATALLSTTLEKAFSILESNSVPKEECVLFIHPKTYWNRIMGIAKYYDASQFGKPSVPQGAHDILYGVPVVITSQIPAGTAGSEGGRRNLLIHKSALVYAFGALPGGTQAGVRIQEKPSESLKVRFIGDIAYGVSYTRPLGGVRIIDKTL